MTIMSEEDARRQEAEAHKLKGNDLFKGLGIRLSLSLILV